MWKWVMIVGLVTVAGCAENPVTDVGNPVIVAKPPAAEAGPASPNSPMMASPNVLTITGLPTILVTQPGRENRIPSVEIKSGLGIQSVTAACEPASRASIQLTSPAFDSVADKNLYTASLSITATAAATCWVAATDIEGHAIKASIGIMMSAL